MVINLFDYLLVSPAFELSEVVDIIDFYMEQEDPESMEEVKKELKHAFSP